MLIKFNSKLTYRKTNLRLAGENNDHEPGDKKAFPHMHGGDNPAKLESG